MTNINTCLLPSCMPSVLWCCWLGGRKGIRPVKKWVVGSWHGYLFAARCRLAYVPADAIPLTVSSFSKIQTGFALLVPAYLGRPGKRAVKWVCVCVPSSMATCCWRHRHVMAVKAPKCKQFNKILWDKTGYAAENFVRVFWAEIAGLSSVELLVWRRLIKLKLPC